MEIHDLRSFIRENVPQTEHKALMDLIDEELAESWCQGYESAIFDVQNGLADLDEGGEFLGDFGPTNLLSGEEDWCDWDQRWEPYP